MVVRKGVEYDEKIIFNQDFDGTFHPLSLPPIDLEKLHI